MGASLALLAFAPVAGARAPASVATPHPPEARGAEARLLAVYRSIGEARMGEALHLAEDLVKDVPTFQLAQLVYGDLLLAKAGPLPDFAAVPPRLSASAPQQLEQLRAEARQRLEGIRFRPPEGSVPRQFLQLSPSSRHAVAVDASRSRLYVFENRNGVLTLVSDHYASVGKLGIEKQTEGDQRTPLGVYYITSRLDRQQLDPFYGVGALPLNYPNEFDRRMGKTGGGIWLHGVPQSTYSRAPNSTDGCVALANAELERLLGTLEPRRTPVLISRQLDWVDAKTIDAERKQFTDLLEQWRQARSGTQIDPLMTHYSEQFQRGSLDLAQYRTLAQRELAAAQGRSVVLKDVSILSWKHKSEVMVVTFGEVRQGSMGGPIKRQYWGKEAGQWKIFFEGVVG